MENKVYHTVMETPIGTLTLMCDDLGLTRVHFGTFPDSSGKNETHPILEQTKAELQEYFHKKRTRFEIPLHLIGTEFQKRVWNELSTIPYGETKTYSQIAVAINNPKACRAVGLANHNNPIAIIVPCHRVIGKNGTLTGYAGGLTIKSALLELEQS